MAKYRCCLCLTTKCKHIKSEMVLVGHVYILNTLSLVSITIPYFPSQISCLDPQARLYYLGERKSDMETLRQAIQNCNY